MNIGKIEITKYSDKWKIPFLQLMNGANAHQPEYEPFTSPEVMEAFVLKRKGYQKNCHFLGLIDDEPVAYLIGYVEKIGPQIAGRIVINAIKSEGAQIVCKKLLSLGVSYFKSLGLMKAFASIHDGNEFLVPDLVRLDFKEKRRIYKLGFIVSSPLPSIEVPRLPGEIEIRTAHLQDCESLASVYNENFKDSFFSSPMSAEQFLKILEEPRTRRVGYLVATRNRKMIGFSGRDIGSNPQNKDESLGWISALAVVPSERGKGVGKALFLSSLRHLVEDGAKEIHLTVDAENESALGLYKSVGFRVTDDKLQVLYGVSL